MKHNASTKQWLNPISSAAVLALLLAAGNAAALGLGSIHVKSSLGEVFSADVDVNALTPAEAEGLRVNLADPMAYEAAGLEMSEALQGAAVSLEKRADGRSYLQIRGMRPVNDPFIDLLIQTESQESGRATRGYTVLIDPPAGLAKAPKISSPAIALAPKTKSKAKAPRMAVPPVDAPAEPIATTEAAPVPESKVEASSSTPAAIDGAGVRVQRGTTAGAIARQLAVQQGVSFDQMLAALLRQNPEAFIGGNVNRVKTGAVLQTPSAEQANSVNQKEAKRQWLSSGNDFKQYRRRLAQTPGSTVDGSTGRSSHGSVAGEVADHGSAAATRDKLTLGKARSRRSAEDRVIRKRHRAESSSRQAELAKNIDELKKLSGVANSNTGNGSAAPAAKNKSNSAVIVPSPVLGSQMAAKTAATKATPSPVPVATKAPTVAPTIAPTAAPTVEPTAASTLVATEASAVASAAAPSASSAASAAEAAVSAASSAAAVAEVKPSPTAAPTLAPSNADAGAGAGLLDTLSNWALPLGGLLGAGVLGGLGFAFLRRRKNKAGAGDSAAFLESKLEADSFFDASGGQQVDTASRSSGISSSMVYSPSQLDAAGDVDPVAEAGVYMAYNRDQQAEDILKEAMRISPSRVAIYTTLMEIYAKRGDIKAFDVVAREARHLTGGHGSDWEKALELGRQVDPSNPMYGDGTGEPSTAREDQNSAAPEEEPVEYARPAVAPTAPMSLDQAQATAKIEAEDLDMVFRNSDFRLSESQDLASAPSPAPVHLETMPMQVETASAAAPVAHAPTEHMDLNFDLGAPAADAAGTDIQFTEAALSGHADLAIAEPLKFDMSDLSLDLGAPDMAASADAQDPWRTKLDLAHEFAGLGDNDGARAYAEDVAANAPDDVAQQARIFIASLV